MRTGTAHPGSYQPHDRMPATFPACRDFAATVCSVINSSLQYNAVMRQSCSQKDRSTFCLLLQGPLLWLQGAHYR